MSERKDQSPRNMPFIILRANLETPDTTPVYVMEKLPLLSTGVLYVSYAMGDTVPSLNENGFLKGAIFLKNNQADGTAARYQNVGDETNCDFQLMAGAETTITGVTLDQALVGGGSSGDVTIAIGFAVRNETGGTLTKGSLVRLSGYSAAQSKLLVVAADANAAGGQAGYVLTADIANNANGTVYGAALVTNINTDAAAAVGDPLYLSETAGGFTPTAPTASSSFVQKVGIVVTKHATTGSALFFPALSPMQKFGSNEFQAASVGADKIAETASHTATADGTGTGAVNALTGFRKFVTVTSAAATDQVSLPGINVGTIGQEIFLTVGANGFELITSASSNATINQVDSDGTNQLDVPANSTVRCTQISGTAWLAEIIAATTISIVAPDND